MKIFTNDNIKAIERMSHESLKINEAEVARRMGEGSAGEIALRWRSSKHTVIFAGPGTNGAYALATARALMQQGFNPVIYLFNINGKKLTTTCRAMRDELMDDFPEATLREVVREFNVPELNGTTLVIDGLFGSGLRAPLEGGFQSLVRYINESQATVVSLDVPSGMFPDWNPHAIARNIVHASLTLSVQFPHLAFFFSENAELVGEWRTIDVGMSREAVAATPTPYHLVEMPEVSHLLKPRKEFSSKADYGNAIIFAGSQGMMGASIFAALGALRAGVGKLTMHVPQCGVDVMQTRVPEAMCLADASRAMLTDMTQVRPFNACGVGPGIGTSNATIAALEKLLKSSEHPMVIDADALNCIAESPNLLNFVPKLSVLTPHAGEFDRLFGQHTGDEARVHKALEMSRHYNILIVLKGRYTALIRPDGKVYFNSSGTPALATPGSGDVLTGVITGLMAQGYKPEVSALLGVFVHGRAGELAADVQGLYGVLASDVANAVGMAIKEIMKFRN